MILVVVMTDDSRGTPCSEVEVVYKGSRYGAEGGSDGERCDGARHQDFLQEVKGLPSSANEVTW
jgi:hypothetical protein